MYVLVAWAVRRVARSLGRDRVADAQPRSHGLREGRHRDHAIGVERVDRRQRVAAEAQEAVRVVLDDREAEAMRELDEALAPGQRQRRAARVLERRDHVQERRRTRPPEIVLERIDIEPVLVHRHADRLGAGAAQQDQRAVVGRRLDEDALGARALDQQLRQEQERLQAAVRRDDPLGRHAVTGADPRAQPRMPTAAEVGERQGGLAGERLVGSRAEVVDREEVGAGNAARKGNLSHPRRVPGAPGTRLKEDLQDATGREEPEEHKNGGTRQVAYVNNHNRNLGTPQWLRVQVGGDRVTMSAALCRSPNANSNGP